MKSLFRTAAVAAILSSCAAPSPSGNQGEASTNQQDLAQIITPVKDSIIDKKDWIESSIYYLKFDNRFLDSLIQKSNNEALAEIKEMAGSKEDISEDMVEEVSYTNELWVNYTYTTQGNLISILQYSSVYLGGAHGMQYLTSIVTDPQKQKIYTLQDFFVSDPVAALQNKVREQLKRELGFTEFIEDGTKELRDFSTFTIANDSITFHFQPYQVAPYCEGTPETKFSIKDLPEFKIPN